MSGKTSPARRAFAAFLALCTVSAGSGGVCTVRVMAEGQQIVISTPEQFMDFAKNCVLDTWSEGKTIVLDADLDFTGEEFSCIPVFRGHFEGNGHTIKGLKLDRKGSKIGLFRTVENKGVVKDLTVEGDAAPGGSAESVGLIAGENYGRITGCSVSGTVTGTYATGGLVGINFGTLSDCTSSAGVTGVEDTGGIVGTSEGTIEACVNWGEVNTSEADENLTDPIENIGGIVGSTTGSVRGCTNYGKVGYPHIGYHVGGVAGVHSGVLSSCVNEGEVLGRRGVGGIAGRFLPDTDLIYGQDPKDTLNTALSDLSGLFTTLSDQVSDTANNGTAHLDQVHGSLEDLRQEAGKELDQLNAIFGQLDAAFDELDAALEEADGISNDMSDIQHTVDSALTMANDDAQKALDDIYASGQEINGVADTINGRFQDFSDGANQNIDDIRAALNTLREKMNAIPDVGDEGVREMTDDVNKYARQAGEALDDLHAAMNALSAQLEMVGDVFTNCDKIIHGEGWLFQKIAALRKEIRKLQNVNFHEPMEDMAGAAGELGSSLTRMGTALRGDYSTMSDDVRAAWEEASDSVDGLLDTAQGLRDTVTNFTDGVSGDAEKINGQVDRIEDTLDTWSDQISSVGGGAQDQVDAYLDVAGGRLDTVGDRLDAIGQNQDNISTTVREEMMHNLRNEIQDSLDALSETFSSMTAGVRTSNDEIRGTVDAITNQLEKVRLAANGMTQEPEYTVDDQSTDADATDGLMQDSQNRGAVEGDANVGGIAGLISVQLSNDPEEEWDWDADRTGLLADVTAIVRAAVRACENTGEIQARNESAGGIVGRADLGAVLDCLNTGNVTVENGSWCGGVVGLSKKAVRGCSALCSVTGVDQVGGIAGEASELLNCRSMVLVDADGEETGAIAGSVDGDGKVSGNYTVAEGLGCLDGVDRDGQAQGLPYDAFANLPALPEIFQSFALTFLTEEGETVETLPFGYDGNVDVGAVPAPPAKEGFYAAWEPFETKHLTRSRNVTVVYTPWETTISSGGTRPRMLVEGSFSPDAAVSVSDLSSDDLPTGGQMRDGWQYQVSDAQGENLTDSVTVRVLCPDERGTVWFRGQSGESWTSAADAVRDGSYLIFQAPVRGDMVVMASHAPSFAVVAGTVAAVLAVLLILRKATARKQKQRKIPAVSETTPGQET